MTDQEKIESLESAVRSMLGAAIGAMFDAGRSGEYIRGIVGEMIGIVEHAMSPEGRGLADHIVDHLHGGVQQLRDEARDAPPSPLDRPESGPREESPE